MSRKRKREPSNPTKGLNQDGQVKSRASKRSRGEVDLSLVQVYEDLANEDEEIRLNATQVLLSKALVEGGSDGDQPKKVVVRLIRGLCSGRKAARLGFSIALTEILLQLFGPSKGKHPDFMLNIPDLLETLDLQTRVSGNVSGQEERDHYLGRLFGAKAVLESGILLSKDAEIQHWHRVLDLVFEVAKKKAWLREECGWVVYRTLQSLKSQNADATYVREIIDRLHANSLTKTSEGAAIWVFVLTRFPSVKLPKGVWHHNSPLDRKERSTLARVLKESALVESQDEKISQKGSWKPSLHFAWNVIIAVLLGQHDSNGISKSEKRTTFAEFWTEAVDNGLFAAAASRERKYLGFLLFQKMLQDTPSPTNPAVFSKNLVSCLVNQLAAEERYLHLAAEKSMKVVYTRVQKEKELAVKIVDQFASLDGHVDFDALLRTRVIEKLLSYTHVDAWGEIASILANLVTRPQVRDDRAATVRRQSVIDQLVSVFKSRLSLETTDTKPISEILALLAKHAYFEVKSGVGELDKIPQPPVSAESREMFRSRLTSCLTHLVGKCPDPAAYPYSVICYIRLREETDDEVVPLLSTSSSVSKVIRQGWRTLENIDAKGKSAEGPEKHYLGTLKLLLSLTILQIYNGEADAVNVLNELRDYYDSLSKHSYDDEQSQASESMVEILLGLVSKPSLLFRRVVQQVFSASVKNISINGLQPMIRVLRTKENLSGQGEMFEQSDEDVSDGEASDVEEVSQKSIASSTSHSEDGTQSGISDATSSDDSDSMEEAEGIDGELAEFDKKLAQALGTRRVDEDPAVNSQDESTDEDMNDEQMESLDVHLEKIFRERKKAASRRGEKKAAKETIINFKCRVLELLEIFIKQRHSEEVTFKLILPLLNAIQTTASKQVSDKACYMVREYAKLCKGKGIPAFADTDATFAILESVHSEAAKEGSNAYHSACSQASTLLTKVLAAKDRENLRRVVSVYAFTQERFLLDPKCKVTASFFHDWQNYCNSSRIK